MTPKEKVWPKYSYLGWPVLGGDFSIGSRSYPRIGPHDLGVQIDIIGGFLSVRVPWGEGVVRGPEIGNVLLGKNTWPFSGPGERSRRTETGNLQEIAVRIWWEPSRGTKLAKKGRKSAKLPGCRAEAEVAII